MSDQRKESNEKPMDPGSAYRLGQSDSDTVRPNARGGYSSGGTDIEDELTATELRRARLMQKIRELPSRAKAMWKNYRADASTHIREGIVGFALGICAYLLGTCKLSFDSYPLGLALLCASPKKVVWIFFGLCISALSMPEGALVYVFAYTAAISVRILARLLIDTPPDDDGARSGSGIKGRMQQLFFESLYLRMATGCAASFIVGLYFLTARGFVYYDLFSAVFSMLCTPVAVLLYSGCFEENRVDERFRQPALASLAVSLTFALRGLSFIGISVGVFFAFFITVYVCRQRGLWQGMLLGLLCGLAYSPAYAPMFALSGATASLVWSVSSTWAMTAACALAVMWGFYVEGVSAVSHILPAAMLSSVSYIGAQKLTFFPAAKDLLFSGKYCSDMNDADIWRMSRKKGEKELLELSDTFDVLSEIFYNLSDRLSRPGIPELRRMCDEVYDRYCPSCPNCKLCWEIEYSESACLINSIGDMLSERGVASVDELPEYMRSRCAALPGIISEINKKSGQLALASGVSDKTSVFAMDYASISSILSDAAKRGREDALPDPALTDKLTVLLRRFGFGEGGVSVYGTRQKQIIARGFDMSGTGSGMREIKIAIESECGFPISDPIIELSEGVMTLKASQARRLTAKCVLRVNNTGEEECGDTVAAFESNGDKQCVLISDGMGRGREAAFTSGVSSLFLQKLLSCGNRAETVIKMLGNFIRSKSGECSATVDLAEIDLMNGKTEFCKCGAAASFVKRGSNLFKLSANTVPLGILSQGDVGKLTFDVQPGDVIIMLSDGVALGNDDSIWLLDLLGGGFDHNLDVMAEKIISEARRNRSDDDISVALVRIDDVKNV